jgi:hypothetical protein
VLSTRTFCTFMRAFSPFELRGGRVYEDTRGSCHRGHTPLEFLRSDLEFSKERCSLRGAGRQLARATRGWNVWHDVARFTTIRDWRAAFLAASSSLGMWSSVPKYRSVATGRTRSDCTTHGERVGIDQRS